MGVFDQFVLSFDAHQRQRWWVYYGAIGAPFTLLLSLSFLALYSLRWRPGRVLRYAA